MPHAYRFYIPHDTPSEGEVSLPPEEAHHAARVVRVRVDDEIELFDGAGREWTGVVAHVSKDKVRVRVGDARVVDAPRLRLTLVQAWPNHEKTVEAIVRRGVELGVTAFHFFRGGHSERAPKASDKWTKLAIETCKQCRRSWLPEFHVSIGLAEALEACRGAVLIATTEREAVAIGDAVREEDVAIAVGPEGDFTDEELALAIDRGAVPISLGDAILRSEIAATVAIALVQYERGLLGPRSEKQ